MTTRINVNERTNTISYKNNKLSSLRRALACNNKLSMKYDVQLININIHPIYMALNSRRPQQSSSRLPMGNGQDLGYPVENIKTQGTLDSENPSELDDPMDVYLNVQ